MRSALAFLAITAALAACNPQQAADQFMRKTARAVIVPVLSTEMPTDVAQRAADCIMDAAEPAELRAVAADIGNSAGSQTIENIRNLALRPQSVACFIQNSVPLVKG